MEGIRLRYRGRPCCRGGMRLPRTTGGVKDAPSTQRDRFSFPRSDKSESPRDLRPRRSPRRRPPLKLAKFAGSRRSPSSTRRLGDAIDADGRPVPESLVRVALRGVANSVAAEIAAIDLDDLISDVILGIGKVARARDDEAVRKNQGAARGGICCCHKSEDAFASYEDAPASLRSRYTLVRAMSAGRREKNNADPRRSPGPAWIRAQARRVPPHGSDRDARTARPINLPISGLRAALGMRLRTAVPGRALGNSVQGAATRCTNGRCQLTTTLKMTCALAICCRRRRQLPGQTRRAAGSTE